MSSRWDPEHGSDGQDKRGKLVEKNEKDSCSEEGEGKPEGRGEAGPGGLFKGQRGHIGPKEARLGLSAPVRYAAYTVTCLPPDTHRWTAIFTDSWQAAAAEHRARSPFVTVQDASVRYTPRSEGHAPPSRHPVGDAPAVEPT